MSEQVMTDQVVGFLVMRRFELATGKTDWQYISDVTITGVICGYDRKEQYARQLTQWQLNHVKQQLDYVKAKYTVLPVWSEGEKND